MGNPATETDVVEAIAALYTLPPKKVDMSQVNGRRKRLLKQLFAPIKRFAELLVRL
jgi:hypothetical protein